MQPELLHANIDAGVTHVQIQMSLCVNVAFTQHVLHKQLNVVT